MRDRAGGLRGTDRLGMVEQLASAPFWADKRADIAITEVAADGRERAVTFEELDENIGHAAARLHAGGLKSGQHLALAADNSLEHVYCLLGALRLGAVVCLINTKLALADQQALIDEADCVLVASDRAFETNLPLIDISKLTGAVDLRAPYWSPGEEDLALIMYTSGSSGLPKGVPISHHGYSWALRQFTGLAETMAGRSAIVAAPLFHMNGQFHLLNLLSSGAHVVLMKTFSASGMLNAIVRHGVVRVTGVPTMAALMAEAIETGSGHSVDHVEQIGLGSSPLSKQLLSRIQAAFPSANITNGFGTTETGPVSFSAHPDGLPTPPTALGALMAGVEARLVDGPSEDEGILHVRNPMTLKGYWKRPDDSAARLTEDGWYITGDRMRRDENGFYSFVGRADDMMQVGAENVFPASVEQLLERHEGVVEAAVVAVPHAVKNEAPVAFVIRSDPSLSEDDLKAYTIENGPAYAHPRRIFFVESLPLAATNKIDRKALTQRALDEISGSL
ncbi:MAG: class I adenylate-forming enzyme family protein [Pseudomonadota bacterium]